MRIKINEPKAKFKKAPIKANLVGEFSQKREGG